MTETETRNLDRTLRYLLDQHGRADFMRLIQDLTNEKLTGGDLAREWGLSRQRVHQLRTLLVNQTVTVERRLKQDVAAFVESQI